MEGDTLHEPMNLQAAELRVFLLEGRCSCRRRVSAPAALSTCSWEETCGSFLTPPILFSPSSTNPTGQWVCGVLSPQLLSAGPPRLSLPDTCVYPLHTHPHVDPGGLAAAVPPSPWLACGRGAMDPALPPAAPADRAAGHPTAGWCPPISACHWTGRVAGGGACRHAFGEVGKRILWPVNFF